MAAKCLGFPLLMLTLAAAMPLGGLRGNEVGQGHKHTRVLWTRVRGTQYCAGHTL